MFGYKLESNMPVSNWTMVKQGAKKVEIVGVSDKLMLNYWEHYQVHSCLHRLFTRER